MTLRVQKIEVKDLLVFKGRQLLELLVSVFIKDLVIGRNFVESLEIL